MKFDVAALVSASGGQLVRGDKATRFESFSNDSRSMTPGGCFIAIQAERDGHDFIDDAVRSGAVVAITDREIADSVGAGIAVVRVDSTIAALARVARFAHREFQPKSVVVGITGSTGKTSTKDLCAAALQSVRVHATPQSFNNEIGLPLTILSASENVDVLILEMGARFRGNIRELCEIVAPAVGIITNIGLAHAEHLGGITGVLSTKGELLEALPADGFAIIPAGKFSNELAARTHVETVLVGTDTDTDGDAPCDVLVRVLELDDQLRPTVHVNTPWGSTDMKVGLRGAHQAVNAAMALTSAVRCGVALDVAAAGIASATGSSWRMEFSNLADDITVINDAYNANPTSMQAAIAALAAAPCRGHRIAVLGAMRELGDASEGEHRRIGALLVDASIDSLIGVGREGEWIMAGAMDRIDSTGAIALDTVEIVTNAESACDAVDRIICTGDTVLVKASRAIGLESVARSLGLRDATSRPQ